MNPLDAICDTEAERHVLGALMLDGAECIDDVRAILPNTNSFSDLRHQLIYRAILLLAQSGLPMDYLSVRQQLQALPGERRGSFFDALDEAGGAPYLMQISSDAFSTASALGCGSASPATAICPPPAANRPWSRRAAISPTPRACPRRAMSSKRNWSLAIGAGGSRFR